MNEECKRLMDTNSVLEAKVEALLKSQAQKDEDIARLRTLASEALRACFHLSERLTILDTRP